MDQQTVTTLLIVAVVATAVLIALALVVPRVARRDDVPLAVSAAPGGDGRAEARAGDQGGAFAFGTPVGPGRADRPVDDTRTEAPPMTATEPGTLLNPAEWARVVTDEDARVRRYRRPATIVMLDLDGLDRLIERLGEPARERLVPAVADTIQRQAREADHVALLGPGRFGVLLPETDEIQAINYVERVRRACDLWLESGAIAMRLAMGWASTSAEDGLNDAARIATERMFAEIHRNARRTTDLVGNAAPELEPDRPVSRGA